MSDKIKLAFGFWSLNAVMRGIPSRFQIPHDVLIPVPKSRFRDFLKIPINPGPSFDFGTGFGILKLSILFWIALPLIQTSEAIYVDFAGTLH